MMTKCYHANNFEMQVSWCKKMYQTDTVEIMKIMKLTSLARKQSELHKIFYHITLELKVL